MSKSLKRDFKRMQRIAEDYAQMTETALNQRDAARAEVARFQKLVTQLKDVSICLRCLTEAAK